MATTMEIVTGISQVLSNTYDGALDENGEPIKIGLKREEGNPLMDSRVMDGFNVKFHGDKMIISYHAEIRLKDVYAKNFESDTEQMIEDIASFLKKEYKKVTGSTLALTAEGEMDAIVQNTSRVRTWVQANKTYAIGGLNEGAEPVNSPSGEDNLEVDFKTFLDKGGWGTKTKGDSRDKPTEGQPTRVDGKIKARKDIHSAYKAE